jgi:(p)ppGpp synthase/HD superfamily hydrolase
MDHFAQTHLQLYRQLQDTSYSDEDLLLVDRTYQIAMRIFSGYYRPNKKPFLMHLIGVASVLTNVRQPAYVVAAGLLHSAYLFGSGRRGKQVKPHYRKQITEALGSNVERLIYAYSNSRWSVHDFSDRVDNLQDLTTEERQLYLIKLADIHEEFLDAGHLYQPRKKLLWDEETNESWVQDAVRLLERSGYEPWARELQLAVDPNMRNIPVAILGKTCSSYILAPGLSSSHFKDRLVRWLSRH